MIKRPAPGRATSCRWVTIDRRAAPITRRQHGENAQPCDGRGQPIVACRQLQPQVGPIRKLKEAERLPHRLGYSHAEDRPHGDRQPGQRKALQEVDGDHLPRAGAPALENGDLGTLPVHDHPGRERHEVEDEAHDGRAEDEQRELDSGSLLIRGDKDAVQSGFHDRVRCNGLRQRVKSAQPADDALVVRGADGVRVEVRVPGSLTVEAGSKTKRPLTKASRSTITAPWSKSPIFLNQ